MCCSIGYEDKINKHLPKPITRSIHPPYIKLYIYIYISTWIFENGTARSRCLSRSVANIFCRSETISKVANIKIMSSRSNFFSSPLSSLPSLFSSVWFGGCSESTWFQTWFRCRSSKGGQIFRSHLFKNPGRYTYINE